MDASDAEYYRTKVENFEKANFELETNYHHQSTIIKSAIEKLNETIDAVRKNTELSQNLKLDVEWIKTIQNRNVMYNQFRFLFDELSSYSEIVINKIRRDQDCLFDITQSARRGLIHDSLMNPEIMLSEMENIQLKLKNDRFPLELNKMNLYKILNLAEFIVYEADNIFIINVPLSSSDKYITYLQYHKCTKANKQQRIQISPVSTRLHCNQQ